MTVQVAPPSLALGGYARAIAMGRGALSDAVAFGEGNREAWRDTPAALLTLKAAVAAMRAPRHNWCLCGRTTWRRWCANGGSAGRGNRRRASSFSTTCNLAESAAMSTSFDFEKMAADVVASAKEFLTRATAAISKRVDELEHRATRNSEHVARLETRLAALERKVGTK